MRDLANAIALLAFLLFSAFICANITYCTRQKEIYDHQIEMKQLDVEIERAKNPD